MVYVYYYDVNLRNIIYEAVPRAVKMFPDRYPYLMPYNYLNRNYANDHDGNSNYRSKKNRGNNHDVNYTNKKISDYIHNDINSFNNRKYENNYTKTTVSVPREKKFSKSDFMKITTDPRWTDLCKKLRQQQ